MSRLQRLFTEQGQSPWLDNLERDYLAGGKLERLVGEGVRGVTSNPTILQKAITGANDYDQQLRELAIARADPISAFWSLAIEDVTGALGVLRPVYDASDGGDGYVSIELEPDLAHDTAGSIRAARDLHQRIAQPNLFVKIPATPEGVPAIQAMLAEGRNINVTLIFGLTRYREVIEAYLSGLEECRGDLRNVHSVASFFVSRVDTKVDQLLEGIGTKEALHLRGRTAVAQAKLAFQLFEELFASPRWQALAGRGAHLQRPLWASTSTKNPRYPGLLYVDNLIGPDTVNTMPEATIAAFNDHGSIRRAIDDGVEEGRRALQALEEVGVDLEDVSRTLENEGVATFADSFDQAVKAVESKLLEVAHR